MYANHESEGNNQINITEEINCCDKTSLLPRYIHIGVLASKSSKADPTLVPTQELSALCLTLGFYNQIAAAANSLKRERKREREKGQLQPRFRERERERFNFVKTTAIRSFFLYLPTSRSCLSIIYLPLPQYTVLEQIYFQDPTNHHISNKSHFRTMQLLAFILDYIICQKN